MTQTSRGVRINSVFKTDYFGDYYKVNLINNGTQILVTHTTTLSHGRKKVETWKRDVAEVWEEFDENYVDRVTKVKGRWNTMVRAKGRAIDFKSKLVTYEWTSTTRVDAGAESLTKQFKLDGIDEEEISDIIEDWNSLSNKEKGEVWNEYHKSSTVSAYGSSSTDEKVSMHTDGSAYLNAFKEAIAKVKG